MYLQVDRFYAKVIMLLKIFLIFQSVLMVGIFLHVQFINLGVIWFSKVPRKRSDLSNSDPFNLEKYKHVKPTRSSDRLNPKSVCVN